MDSAKEQLIEATVRLLKELNDPQKITTRKIAEAANVNLAMVNYYFNSKDELLNIAITRIVSKKAEYVKLTQDMDKTPKERLLEFIISTADLTYEFSELTRPVIPYVMLKSDIDLPYQILPYIKEHFYEQKNEAECRTIAFQIISFMQLIFYRMEDYKKFSGIDISDEIQRHQFCQMIVDNLIYEKKGE
jgi:AcrR family transcriptional regulator